jgi:hypothetical protein
MFPGAEPGEPSIERPRGFQYRAEFIKPSDDTDEVE